MRGGSLGLGRIRGLGGVTSWLGLGLGFRGLVEGVGLLALSLCASRLIIFSFIVITAFRFEAPSPWPTSSALWHPAVPSASTPIVLPYLSTSSPTLS